MGPGVDSLVMGGRACTHVAELLATASRGEVHSVFSSSMNVAIGGELVHVGPSSRPLSCTGLSIDDDALAAFLPLARRSDAAVVRAGVLWVRAADARLGVGLSSLTPVDLSVRGLRMGPEDLAPIGGALARYLSGHPCGVEGDRALEEATRLLVRPNPGGGELTRAITLLAGRGPGLTPSGDDMLVGYGLGLWLLGEEAPFLRALLAVRPRTTDVSRAHLSALADGRVSESLRALAEAVHAHASRSRIARAIEEVGGIGHTSGADALRGLGIACARARVELGAGCLSAVGW